MLSYLDFKKKFNIQLKKYIDSELLLIEKSIKDPFVQKDVLSYAKKFSRGGKRLRPYVTYLAFHMCKGKSIAGVFDVCVSLELLHMSCLIHDDIMDNAKTRHNMLTAYFYVKNNIIKRKDSVGDIEHTALSQSILLGDLFYAFSLKKLLHVRKISQRKTDRIGDVYANMVAQTIAGQMMDINHTSRKRVKDELITIKNILKTANYSFSKPILIGGILAGKKKQIAPFAHAFGRHVGLAFQAQDDLLDISDSSKIAGKDTLKDVAQGEHTIFTQYIFKNGTTTQKKKLASLMGSGHVSLRNKKELKNIYQESGAFEFGKSYISTSIKRARILLNTLPRKTFSIEVMEPLLEELEKRI